MPDIIINSFSAAISFLSGMLAIFYLPNNKKGNVWFGIFLISVGFAFLNKIMWQEGLYIKFPNVSPVCELFHFIVAPSFYLSIWYYTHVSEINFKIKILHFTPALLFIVFMSLPYFLSIGHISELLSKPINSILGSFMRIAFPIQIIIYWILSYRLLKKHSHSILLFSSQKKEIDLNWLLSILVWIFLLIVLGITIDMKENSNLNSTSAYLHLIFILFVIYNLLRQKEVFFKDENKNSTLEAIIYPKTKFQEEKPISRLNENELIKYKTVLDNLLENEEIFTDPEINLSSLANKIDISMNDLSFMINNSYNMNFYTLINKYRIEKVKTMLVDKQYNHLTILGIAYEAGFTSKSTFNNAFKKETGLTPSEYMKTNVLKVV